MNKIIFTVNIGDYAPEIRAITRPPLEYWAEKIGAELIDITQRHFKALNDLPCDLDAKLQMFGLAKEHPADWYIYIDSDAYIGHDFPDVVELVHKDTCISGRSMNYQTRWKIDDYGRRYGVKCNDIGTFFLAFSDWCLDLVHYPDESIEAMLDKIYPLTIELNAPAPQNKQHIMIDYVVSHNVARFGLKMTWLDKIAKDCNFLFHQCYDTTDVKTAYLRVIQRRQQTNFNTAFALDHAFVIETAEEFYKICQADPGAKTRLTPFYEQILKDVERHHEELQAKNVQTDVVPPGQ